jgi:hypothetical protein
MQRDARRSFFNRRAEFEQALLRFSALPDGKNAHPVATVKDSSSPRPVAACASRFCN